MTSWDRPDSDPLGDIRKAIRRMQELSTQATSYMVLSTAMYDRYQWELRKTRIEIDWRKFLFPRSTKIGRWIYRTYCTRIYWPYLDWKDRQR